MGCKLGWILPLVILLLSFSVHAQDDGGKEDLTGKNKLYEFGLHTGNLLPSQITGVTEIMGLGGVRAGFRFAPFTYAEGGVVMGNGNGVQWKNMHIDVRMDMPVENLVALAYVGADSTYYSGDDGNSHIIF